MYPPPMRFTRSSKAGFTNAMSRLRTYWPPCQVEPMCPCTNHSPRQSAMAAPMMSRDLGSGIQQSMMLMPAAWACLISAMESASGWRSSHSPPNPTSLTISPVFPSLR